jgi:hypothetical protein
MSNTTIKTHNSASGLCREMNARICRILSLVATQPWPQDPAIGAVVRLVQEEGAFLRASVIRILDNLLKEKEGFLL